MKNSVVVISIIAAITVIVSSWIFGSAYRYKYKSLQTITVNGNAKKDFESDIAKWSANYSRKNIELKPASDQLAMDREVVRAFLLKQGIPASAIKFESVNIDKEYTYHPTGQGGGYNTFSGYNLRQTVSVESNDLDKVDAVSREISILISQGVELISQASANARQRAENIARESGASLADLVKADLGVFQITGQNDNEEYSYGGVFNTTSRNKTANITVRASYLAD
jgi:hypothetical protein